MEAGFMGTGKHGESSSFTENMKLILAAPKPPRLSFVENRRTEWNPCAKRYDDVESLCELAKGEIWIYDEVLQKKLLKRRINLLLGPRAVKKKVFEARAHEEDTIDMNRVKVSKIGMSDEVMEEKQCHNNMRLNVSGTGKDGCFEKKKLLTEIAPDDGFYDAIANEASVSSTQDDTCIYVKGRMLSTESPMEFLFRRTEDKMVEMNKGLSVMLSRALDDGFRGLIQIGGRYLAVETPSAEINVGIRSKTMEMVGNGINAIFSINLTGLRGSGTKTQKVKLHSEYYRKDSEIRFEYHKVCNIISEEDLMDYYLDHKYISLKDFFCGIVSVSQPKSLKTNCLKFMELKTSLLFGEAPISPYEIGSSLLFFFRIFGDESLSVLVNKVIEYIECTLCELCICPRLANELLFLHETCIFINRIICMEARFRYEQMIDGNPSQGMTIAGEYKTYPSLDGDVCYKVFFEPYDLKAEPLTVLTYHVEGKADKVDASIGSLSLNRRQYASRLASSGSERSTCRIRTEIVVSSSIGSYLSEALENMEIEQMRGHSRAFNRMISLYEKVLEINQRNLGGFLLSDEVGELIISILERSPPLTDEVLLLCTIVKDISSIVPVRVSSLDKALVNCIGKVIFMFTKALRNFLKRDIGDVRAIFEILHKFYLRLHYLQSNIHEELFKSDVHHTIEGENIHRLRKISTKVKTGLEQVRVCRKVYNEHQNLLKVMSYDVESSYRLEEKRVFMQFYDTKKIKDALMNPEVLEKEVLKMIGRGVIADDDIYSQYKLYLYECIKENARIYLGSEYNKIMLSINKYFL